VLREFEDLPARTNLDVEHVQIGLASMQLHYGPIASSDEENHANSRPRICLGGIDRVLHLRLFRSSSAFIRNGSILSPFPALASPGSCPKQHRMASYSDPGFARDSPPSHIPLYRDRSRCILLVRRVSRKGGTLGVFRLKSSFIETGRSP